MSNTAKEVATLGAGCFWCVEAVFKELRGVESVVSGYSGGETASPTYEQVCTGTTGHAEVVQVTFDPSVVSFAEILEVFFSVHDPTTLNRQGADVGTQYRSAVFYHSPEQKETAERLIAGLDAAGALGAPVVTEVTPFREFYPAEDYHQDYFKNNPSQGYCRVVVAPKVSKFRKKFAAKLAAAGAQPRDDVNRALGVGQGHAPGHGQNVEVKYSGPDGVMIDVSQTGWVGTSPLVRE
ncbi:MAG TPA: peptide-methionine (S)-S-oxide reductase MsrA [Pyrinomonadaceae bacterium]|nr:peptide-methionine (S)-S-oxide reductase MsrA [Pyrinomonadaceae bacterium]